jgi:hypothetical protein
LFQNGVKIVHDFPSTLSRRLWEIPRDPTFRDLRNHGIELCDRDALEQRLPVGHAVTGASTGEFTVLLAARDVL